MWTRFYQSANDGCKVFPNIRQGKCECPQFITGPFQGSELHNCFYLTRMKIFPRLPSRNWYVLIWDNSRSVQLGEQTILVTQLTVWNCKTVEQSSSLPEIFNIFVVWHVEHSSVESCARATCGLSCVLFIQGHLKIKRNKIVSQHLHFFFFFFFIIVLCLWHGLCKYVQLWLKFTSGHL